MLPSPKYKTEKISLLLILSFLIIIRYLLIPIEEPKIEILTVSRKNSTEDVLFIILTTLNNCRPHITNDYFVSDLNNIQGYKAIYINLYKENITSLEPNSNKTQKNKILNLYSPEYYLNFLPKDRNQDYYKDIDLFSKSYFALSYFFHETNYRWIYRGVDDSFINVKLVEDYFKNLESKYDPLTKPVILGNCIQKNNKYLQGGSGFLYSRKAVELMLPYYEKVITTCNYFEDVFHNRFLEYLGIELEDATDEHFLGHSLTWSDLSILKSNNIGALRKCPEFKKDKYLKCRFFHAPVCKVVFFHQQCSIEPGLSASRVVFNCNNDAIHYYMENQTGIPRLCAAN